jgi:hypothetical protein
MRIFALLALVAVTLGFAACAKKETTTTTATTSGSTGYSK